MTAVDLESFKPVASLRTDSLSLLNFHSVWMDKEGRGVIVTSDWGADGKNFLIQLGIPSLTVQARCEYSNVAGPNNTSHPIASQSGQCATFSSGSTFEAYLAEEPGITPPSSTHGYICRSPDLEYCPQPETFTSDGQIGMGIETEGHDNLLGSWVQTRAVAIFFSTSTKREFARMDLTHSSAYTKLAASGGKGYLLSLKDGSELTVYRLNDANQ
jgi:hypothetical protein